MASGSDSPLYLDSSAIVKLIAREAESRALADVVAGASGIVTSELALAEVPRAVRRRIASVPQAERVALELGPALSAFLTYDHRQADAAMRNGLQVRAPA